MDEYEQENDKKMIFSLIDNPISQILSFHIIINCRHICINYVCTYEHTFLLYTYVKHFFLLFLLLPTLIFSDRKWLFLQLNTMRNRRKAEPFYINLFCPIFIGWLLLSVCRLVGWSVCWSASRHNFLMDEMWKFHVLFGIFFFWRYLLRQNKMDI